MKTSIVTLLITFCFYLSVYAQAPQDKATELKEQALSSLKQKDYIKARFLKQITGLDVIFLLQAA